MERELNLSNIPGTVLKLEKMGGVIGLEFLDKVFYITDGIMLSQIREIAAELKYLGATPEELAAIVKEAFEA